MTSTGWLLWKLWLVLRAAAALRSWDGFVSLVWATGSGIWRQHHPAMLSKHQTPSPIRTETSVVWKFSKCFKMSKSVETPSQPRQASKIASLNEPRTFYAHRGIDSLQFQILAVGTFLRLRAWRHLLTVIKGDVCRLNSAHLQFKSFPRCFRVHHCASGNRSSNLLTNTPNGVTAALVFLSWGSLSGAASIFLAV